MPWLIGRKHQYKYILSCAQHPEAFSSTREQICSSLMGRALAHSPSPGQCPVKVCVCRKRGCHCAALHSNTHPLLQFKPYILTEQFNQGKSQGNVSQPPPYLDWCVCKQRFLKGFICWILLTCGPFSPLCSNPLSSGAQLTLTTPFPHQAGNAWVFLLITYTDLRSKLDH